MLKLVSVAEMQAIEKAADSAGHSYAAMMEHAGRGLAEVVEESLGYLAESGVLGLVGSGNNGGDTLVALTRLAEKRWKASALLVRPRPPQDPLVARLQAAGGQIFQAADLTEEALQSLLQSHAVLLDGILGTGIRLPLRADLAAFLGNVRRYLQQVAEAPFVVAVDAPSGVDCDSGEAAPETLPADLTVTMAAVKRGLLREPAFSLAGEVRLVGIGLPEDLPAWQAIRRYVPSAEWVRSVLPERPTQAHKGTFGTALVVAGSINYTGAALLAGKAAYRSGAGLVTMAVPAPLHAILAGGFPEATWLLLPHELGVVAESAAAVLRKNLQRPTALLLGPGFGLEESTRNFLAALLEGESRQARQIGFLHQEGDSAAKAHPPLPPVVVDADGLKLLAQIPQWAARLPGPAVLTPHPGEMSVLTGLSRQEIQARRQEIAEEYARQWGHVVVLKGAHTVVAAPDGRAAVIPVATPALARAGSGDVLAGIIVGLRAQGMPAFEAALAGAWLHGMAGLQALETLGHAACVLAGDVLAALPAVFAACA